VITAAPEQLDHAKVTRDGDREAGERLVVRPDRPAAPAGVAPGPS
jgi:hypothetical protein